MGLMWKIQNLRFAPFIHVEKSYNHPRVFNMNESVTELANIWGLALSSIEKELNNKIVFDSFFTDTKIARAEGNVMTEYERNFSGRGQAICSAWVRF